ncbi:cytosolic protein [Aquibacillus sp. 3ASR75-11]|uniref:Cytosolic protein n=1 Tax=Terrihalobacillus insolitus TaxID=2950438 RepID=A0A9X3WRF4_9BACI|nr:cytosolic protein [Terrihalobacillus insolitus]MDC3412609.1 cytosolic protein [Terrihalobacillus insolitus]MDC3423960.1 cytosolic protein [Terrihalobacillus insolitus]
MTVRQVLSKYFSNHSETSEQHWDPLLQTHYFKTTKDKGLQVVKDYLSRSQSFKIKAESKEHGEISFIYKGSKKAFVVATIVMVKPYRTAIDFSITTESSLPFDFGFSHNLAKKLYTQLKKELQFIEN